MHRHLALAVLTGACLGCAEPDYGEVDYAIRTRHFDVLFHPGARLLCEGEYAAIDDLVDVTRAAIDYDGPTARTPLHMWSFGAPEFPCGDGIAGCVLVAAEDDAHVRSISSLHHEVVHVAITAGLASFYAEGLAETLSAVIPPDAEHAFDPRPLLEADRTEFTYWQAAVFANFMLEEFGPETTYAAFRDATKHGARSAFPKWTGQSLDAIAEAFMNAPFRCSSQLVRCAAPGTIVTDSWTFDSVLPCSEEQTLGGDGGEYIDSTLEVSGGTYLVEVDHGWIQVERCAPCAERDSWGISSVDPDPAQAIEFLPGRHSISIGSTPGLFTAHVRFTRQD